MSGVRVEVLRGGLVESVHDVYVAVTTADGRLVARAGRPELPVLARSAIKPFQALPLVLDGAADALGMTGRELALCCASHSGEPEHVEVARSILARAGVGEDALACGAQRPMSREAASALREAGRAPGRIHNNCSGKHAGMLALARHHGWPAEGYHLAGHPVQRRALAEMAGWAGVPEASIGTAVDGCGVVAFSLPLTAVAGAMARLVAAAARGEPGPARIVGAMAEHPFLVAGSHRLCTRLAEVTGGRVLAKVGAEGVYAAADRGRELGLALKTRDGARRGAEVALLAVLGELGLLHARELDALSAWARPRVRNTRDEVVGEIRAVAELVREEADG
jgi:L-asparaginase II